jgi:antitoxin MazE
MKAQLIRIGNSRGVRLPKAVIEQAGLTEEVDLEVRGSTVVIAATGRVRAGWADAARALAATGGGGLLDPETRTHFDEGEWRW